MHERRLFVLLLVAYGWFFVFFPRINNPNELVRVYAARALATQHTWAIGKRTRVPGGFADGGEVYSRWGYVNDKALVCDDPRAQPPRCAGTLYAAKAPGAALLGAPVVLLTGWSKSGAVLALRWVWGILPSIVFWLLFRRFLRAREVSEEAATAATLAGALGSLSLTYGQMFAGHQLAAVALGGAYLAGFWPQRERPALFGFLAAAAVVVEYPSAPAAALLGAFYLYKRPRDVGWVIAGGLAPAVVLIQFHWSAFGAPWSTPYSHLENPDFVRDLSPGFMGISLPTWERFFGSLFAPYVGLFFWAPWMLIAIYAGREKPALAIIGYYLVFQITHALWRGGWVVGPRYITPIVPFAAAAWALQPRAERFFYGAAAAAIAATGLASAVCQGFPLEVINPLREVVWPLWRDGYVAPNPLIALGRISALPYLAALGAAVWWLLRRGGTRAAVTFCALTLVQWAAPASPERGAAHFLESAWSSSYFSPP